VPFDVPDSWVVARLEDLVAPEKNSFADGPFGSNLKTEHYTLEPEVRIIQLSNIGESGWRNGNKKYTTFTHAETISRSKVSPGNIVIAKMMPAGRAVEVPDIDKNYVLSSDAIKFVPSTQMDKQFLLYAINSSLVNMQILDEVQGIGRVRTSLGKMKKYYVPIPPLSEQRRIVAAIESSFAVIDDIECNKIDLRSAVDIAKKRILSLAICGRLVPQDPNDEPVSVLLDRISTERETLIKAGKIKRSKTDSTVVRSDDNSYYENLSDGWTVCRLEDVLEFEQPTKYIVKSTDYNDDFSTPVLTAGKSFIIGFTDEEFGVCTNLPVIIFDDFTTAIKYVDFPFKVKSSAMKILRAHDVDVKYLFYYMQTIECNHTTHKRYWISDFSQKLIALPPLNEQHRIVATIKLAFEQLEQITENLS